MMPKSHRNAKRRRHDMSPTSSSSIALPVVPSNYIPNVKMAEGEDSIDNILAEMAGQQGIPLSSSSVHLSSTIGITSTTTAIAIPKTLPINEPESTVENDTENDAAITSTIKLFNARIPTRPYTKQQMEKIRSWNSIMNNWQRTGTFRNNPTTVEMGEYGGILFVPSFDVEMTRHFKIQALSSYLLDTCKGLKMPAFERWYVC